MKWSILLLSAFYCSAQIGPPGAIVASWGGAPSTGVSGPFQNVTNQAGYPPWAFYLPNSTTYTTNTSVFLADSWTNSWTLTNKAASSTFPARQPAALNNYDTLKFNGTSQYLTSVPFTNDVNFDVWMVMRWNDVTNSSARKIFDGKTVAGCIAQQTAAGVLAWNGSGALTDGPIVTNKWMVWEFVFSGGGLTAYTNNVQVGNSGTAQTKTQNGFAIGSDHFLSSWSPLELAVMVFYGGTNGVYALPGTNTAARALVYGAFTNAFNIAF